MEIIKQQIEATDHPVHEGVANHRSAASRARDAGADGLRRALPPTSTSSPPRDPRQLPAVWRTGRPSRSWWINGELDRRSDIHRLDVREGELQPLIKEAARQERLIAEVSRRRVRDRLTAGIGGGPARAAASGFTITQNSSAVFYAVVAGACGLARRCELDPAIPQALASTALAASHARQRHGVEGAERVEGVALDLLTLGGGNRSLGRRRRVATSTRAWQRRPARRGGCRRQAPGASPSSMAPRYGSTDRCR